jgi:uncharacterized BrkB/YihY/UPF0761 family membrane protein
MTGKEPAGPHAGSITVMLVLLVGLMFGLLSRAAPNARPGGLRWITPGGLTAAILWMVWLWLSNLVPSNRAWPTGESGDQPS